MKNLILIANISLLALSTSFINLPLNQKSFYADKVDIFSDTSVADIKSYYSNLTSGLKGDDLLSSLQSVLETSQTKLAKSTSTTWTNYLLLDRDWVNDPLTSEESQNQKWKEDNVICKPLYESTFTFIKANSPGNYVNREHVFPKSYGFGNDSSSTFLPYAGTDMQNLHMGEATNNQSGHNNYAFGNVQSKSSSKAITSSISKEVTGYLGTGLNGIPVYEPRDEDKGDIARTIFYMAARYHTYEADQDNSPALKLSDSPAKIYENKTTIIASETKDNPCEYGMLTDLLKWNILDPVDDHEIHRNNLCYNAVQKNRNPFIDYPSWADIAFKDSTSGIDLSLTPSQVGVSSGSEEKPDDSDEGSGNFFEDFFNSKYYVYVIIGGLVLIAFLISFFSSRAKKKKAKKTNDKNQKKE